MSAYEIIASFAVGGWIIVLLLLLRHYTQRAARAAESWAQKPGTTGHREQPEHDATRPAVPGQRNPS